MRDFRKYLDQQMSDPEFAAEFGAQRPEYEAILSRIHLSEPPRQEAIG